MPDEPTPQRAAPDTAVDDAARDVTLARRLNDYARDEVPLGPLLEALPERAQRVLRRRRIGLGVVLGTIAAASLVVSVFVQRADHHVVTATPTTIAPAPPTVTSTVRVPSTLPTGVSLEQLPADTPHAGIQDWDQTLPNGDVQFSCIYAFGFVQYAATAGVVHSESAGARLPGWYVTPGDNDNTFTDGTNTVVVSGAAQPDASGSRCRLRVTAQGLPPTTTLPPPGLVSLDTLPSGANGAIPDKDLGDGNVIFTCNYTFGWAYFGANATQVAFLSAHETLPGWSSTMLLPDLQPTQQIRFTNGTETVLVTASAQPDASGSHCHAERQGT